MTLGFFSRQTWPGTWFARRRCGSQLEPTHVVLRWALDSFLSFLLVLIPTEPLPYRHSVDNEVNHFRGAAELVDDSFDRV